MSGADTIARLVLVARDILDDEQLELQREDQFSLVPGWDSLNHMRMIVAVERAFGITFDTSEQLGFTRIADLADAIERRSGRGRSG